MTLNGFSDNLHISWPVATDAYGQAGRGAIIVDTTQQPAEGLGHPFGYFTQTFVEERDDEDAKRMVREYALAERVHGPNCDSTNIQKRGQHDRYSY